MKDILFTYFVNIIFSSIAGIIIYLCAKNAGMDIAIIVSFGVLIGTQWQKKWEKKISN